MTERLFDPAPLLSIVRGMADGDAAAFLGVTIRSITRWRNEGTRLKHHTADHVAIRAGLHPEILWPGWGGVLVGGEDGDHAALGDPG